MINPIFARELRARWRNNRSFILVFLLSVLLAGMAWWVYLLASRYYYPADGISWSNAGKISRSLFSVLGIGNVLACFLLSPALTAPGIAGERERGLLEGIWLSQLPVRSLVVGRFLSSMAFLCIVQCTMLPLLALCLLMGSVAPLEIGLVVALALVSGGLGSSIGMWASAGSRRPTGAVSLGYGIVFVWSGAIYWFLLENPVYTETGLYLHCLHPVAIAYPLCNGTSVMSNGFTRAPVTLHIEIFVVGAIVLYGVLTGLLLLLAGKRASRPLPPPVWKTVSNPEIEAWKRDLKERQERARREREERLSHKVEDVLLTEIPLAAFVRFKNPLLQREVRGRFRIRQASKLLEFVRSIMLLGLACCWMAILFNVLMPDSRALVSSILLWAFTLLGVPTIGVLSSQSFTREKEGGTWEGVRLSLIRDHELLWAKWLAPIVTTIYWGAPLLIFLPFTIGPIVTEGEGMRGMPWPRFAAAVFFVLTWAGFASALGLLVSWRCRTTAAATSWTLGLLGAAAVVPTWIIASCYQTLSWTENFWPGIRYMLLSPLIRTNALEVLERLVRTQLSIQYYDHPLSHFDGFFLHVIIVWLTTAALVCWLRYSLVRENKERRRSFRLLRPNPNAASE